MLLQKWLKKENISVVEFSKRVNLSYSSVYKYLDGTVKCAESTALLIERATNREVSFIEVMFPLVMEFYEKKWNSTIKCVPTLDTWVEVKIGDCISVDDVFRAKLTMIDGKYSWASTPVESRLNFVPMYWR